MASREEFLLISLASAADGRMSPVQVQKAMFLLKQEASQYLDQNFYEFVPYNYGPFNSSIYDDLKTLADAGDVALENSHDRHWSTYTITGPGKQKADRVRATLPTEMQTYIQNVVSWIKAQSFSTLLRSIYDKYPAFAVNSVFSR